MIARIFAVYLSILPATAFAELVPIQFGQQGDTTRIVFTILNGATWSITQDGPILRITVDGATGFETLQVQDFAPESRVAGISGGLTPDVINVELNCDCISNEYLVNEQFLTVDISNRQELPTSLARQDSFLSLTQPWHQSLARSVEQAPPLDNILPDESSSDILDSTISTGLAQAAYQGFLELRDPGAAPETIEASTNILNNIAIGVESQLQTLFDEPIIGQQVQVFDCEFVSNTLQVSWNYDLTFGLLQGAFRSRIAPSNDTTDPQAALDYATLLVGHGFGQEAIPILQELDLETDFATTLLFIAQVIDHPTPPALVGLENCAEYLAIWGFLHSAGNEDTDLDPRKLMMAFKLLPPMLQQRTIALFGDALARAGYRDFQLELQDFGNTLFAENYAGTETIPPVLDFASPASARDIIRADLTATDLDPDFQTPLSPTSLPLSVLDTLRIERRDTAAEAILLDEILSRQVEDGSHFAVVELLIDSAQSIDPVTLRDLSDVHLTQSVAQMTDPEVLALAFRSELPVMSDTLKQVIRARLDVMNVRAPSAFSNFDQASESASSSNLQLPESSLSTPVLPSLVRAPQDSIPTFAESERLLEGSAAMRNTIETIINDTN